MKIELLIEHANFLPNQFSKGVNWLSYSSIALFKYLQVNETKNAIEI